MGRQRLNPAFTLIEILAVLGLVSILIAALAASISFSSSRVKEASRDLTKDIQSTYFHALRKAKVFRINFLEDSFTYTIEFFEFEEPEPEDRDSEAYRKWEESQREKEEALAELSVEERRAQTEIQLGKFVLMKKKQLKEPVQIRSIFKTTPDGVVEADKEQPQSLMIYPTGEMDSMMIVIEDDAGVVYSLVTNPLNGKVKAFSRALTEEEWLNAFSTE